MGTRASVGIVKNNQYKAVTILYDGYISGVGFDIISYMLNNKSKAFLVTFIDNYKNMKIQLSDILFRDNDNPSIFYNSSLNMNYITDKYEMQYRGDNNVYLFNMRNGILNIDTSINDTMKIDVYKSKLSDIVYKMLEDDYTYYNDSISRILDENREIMNKLFNDGILNSGYIQKLLKESDRYIEKFEKDYKKNLDRIEKFSSEKYLGVKGIDDLKEYINERKDSLRTLYNMIPDKLKYEYTKYYKLYDMVPELNIEHDKIIHELRSISKLNNIYNIEHNKDMDDRSRDI